MFQETGGTWDYIRFIGSAFCRPDLTTEAHRGKAQRYTEFLRINGHGKGSSRTGMSGSANPEAFSSQGQIKFFENISMT